MVHCILVPMIKKVYALTSDGVKKWEFTTEGEIRSTPVVGEDGTIYVGSNDLNVYALNPDGTKKWEHFTSGLRFGKVVTSPAIGADGTLYIDYSKWETACPQPRWYT